MTFVAKSARSLYVDVTKIALSETLITAYLTSAIVPINRNLKHCQICLTYKNRFGERSEEGDKLREDD